MYVWIVPVELVTASRTDERGLYLSLMIILESLVFYTKHGLPGSAASRFTFFLSSIVTTSDLI